MKDVVAGNETPNALEQHSRQTGHALESLSERIIQGWFAGHPPHDLIQLADAAPALLEVAKAALPIVEDLKHEMRFKGGRYKDVAILFQKQADTLRAAIELAEGK